jgi:hypothetical protein
VGDRYADPLPQGQQTEALVDLAENLLELAGTRTKSGSTNFLRLHVLGERSQEGNRFLTPHDENAVPAPPPEDEPNCHQGEAPHTHPRQGQPPQVVLRLKQSKNATPNREWRFSFALLTELSPGGRSLGSTDLCRSFGRASRQPRCGAGPPPSGLSSGCVTKSASHPRASDSTRENEGGAAGTPVSRNRDRFPKGFGRDPAESVLAAVFQDQLNGRAQALYGTPPRFRPARWRLGSQETSQRTIRRRVQ